VLSASKVTAGGSEGINALAQRSGIVEPIGKWFWAAAGRRGRARAERLAGEEGQQVHALSEL
jgi:hypothetical protein